jgi:deoxyribodipyrimidine photo-lyase
MMQKNGIYWFTNDLRLDDNPALIHAANAMDNLVFVYCIEKPMRLSQFQLNASISKNRENFILNSLSALDKQLRELGQHLIVLEKPQSELTKLIDDYAITHIYRNQDYHILDSNSWLDIKAKNQQISFNEISNNRLYRLGHLPFSLAELPDSFSKFRRKAEKLDIDLPLSPPSHLPPPLTDPIPWSKLPSQATGAKPLFKGGEIEAVRHMEKYFQSELPSTYKQTRNGLDGMDYSTKFSPWLAQGCLSARRIIHRLNQYEDEVISNDSTYWIYFELLWREYFQWYAEKYGEQMIAFSGIKDRFPNTSFYPERFQKWCQGTTPYPIVNACMKQLKATGYMSNRGRQLVASCFVHELSLDWRYGAAYMEQQLVDFDLGSNWGNWQYLAGVGADPRGHRQFDLNKQTQTYDPKQQFIDRWQGHADHHPLDSIDASDWPIDLKRTEILA